MRNILFRLETVALSAAIALCAAIALADNGANSVSDKGVLQGRWLVVELNVGGTDITKQSLSDDPTYVQMDGDQFSAQSITSRGSKPYRFSLDETRTPRRIWIRSDDTSIPTLDGIYEINGNKLHLAIRSSDKPPSTNPADFTAGEFIVVIAAEKQRDNATTQP